MDNKENAALRDIMWDKLYEVLEDHHESATELGGDVLTTADKIIESFLDRSPVDK